ncbi:MAG: C40 family peptidase [Candidatus Kapabacteria bacterium]|nr:C40 family peptidase [Ignavibacteriota bacterium]MCW5884163.1 C40 family peptidase [Candidatus Kapabacteria bacterium]
MHKTQEVLIVKNQFLNIDYNFRSFRTIFGIVLLIFITIVVQSCQPSVRFATKSGASNQSKASKGSKSTKEIEIDKLENTDKFKTSYFLTGDTFTDNLIKIAESWLGVPYRYGGESRTGADCSGYVMQVFSEAGVKLPRTSSQQHGFAESIDFTNKQPGDLIFFKNKSAINHVGIYLGKGYMIHASSSQGVIRQSIHDDYFMTRVAGVGRISPKITKKD